MARVGELRVGHVCLTERDRKTTICYINPPKDGVGEA